MKHTCHGLLPLSSKSFMGPLLCFTGAVRFGVTAQGTVQAFVDKSAVELFATHCFVEFMTNGELQSTSCPLPLVPPTPSTRAGASNIAIPSLGSPLVLSRHEDLVGKIGKLIGISKREFLVPMKEFLGGLVILNIVMGVKTCHELSDDMLAIMGELILSVRECP